MTQGRPVVNILHRHEAALFSPHFDSATDGYDVVENGSAHREWDLLVVFEAMTAMETYRVREGGTIFVSGEPPEIGNHSRAFLRQFDAVFCAGAAIRVGQEVSHEQHFNNWHFGYSALQKAYRYDHRTISEMPIPTKSRTLSTVTSNLNYMPMHIRRRALIDQLARDYEGQIDFFGRPHRYLEYKDDAILPYRFHLCVENCSVPDIWTEKIADALLGYAVPVYAGCPNIERYFPDATIAIDLDDYARARTTIDMILSDGERIYQERLGALIAARRSLIDDFDMSSLIGQTMTRVGLAAWKKIGLKPEADFPLAASRDLIARAKRKMTSFAWRKKMAVTNGRK